MMPSLKRSILLPFKKYAFKNRTSDHHFVLRKLPLPRRRCCSLLFSTRRLTSFRHRINLFTTRAISFGRPARIEMRRRCGSEILAQPLRSYTPPWSRADDVPLVRTAR